MDYRSQYLQQKYYFQNTTSVKDAYINDLSIREKSFNVKDNFDVIDPRVKEIERIAELNYIKQKQNEQRHLQQKQKEQSINELKQKQNEYKERLLDYKIQESQKRYLEENSNQKDSEIINANGFQQEYRNNSFSQTLQPQANNRTYISNKQNLTNNINSYQMLDDSQESNLIRSIQSLPLSQSFKSSVNSQNYNQNKGGREKLSFRSKSNIYGQLKNISTGFQQQQGKTEIKLVPISNKIKNDSMAKSLKVGGNVQRENIQSDIEEQYQPDYSKLIIQSKYLISQNNLKEAEILLENLILKIPFHSDCLYLLGDTKRIIGKYRESEILLKKCMQQENYTPFAYKSLAQTYFSLQKYQDSLFYLKKYILFKKDDDEALSILGQCLIKLGENLEASACFNKALEINPNQLEYYLYRSEVNDLLGLRELSQRDYIYFKQNKSDYLSNLSEFSKNLKNKGKILESEQIIQKINILIPIN
ncbi:hypothetical protein ABPG74_010725 [Tetrahymena malaccensis]